MGRKQKVWWSSLCFFAFCLMKLQSGLAMNFNSIKPKLNNFSLLHGQPQTPVVTLTSCFIGRNLDSWTTMLTDHTSQWMYNSWIFTVFHEFSLFTLWLPVNSWIMRKPLPDPVEVVKLYYDWRKSMFPSRVVKKICTCSFSATKKSYLYTVLFKSELTVRCSWFLIPVPIENQEQANVENRVKDWVSRDRKLKIHTAVTQHSMVYSCTNCLYVRNKTNSSFKVNVSSRTSVSSFISSSTVSNACSKCKQTLYTRVQARR